MRETATSSPPAWPPRSTRSGSRAPSASSPWPTKPPSAPSSTRCSSASASRKTSNGFKHMKGKAPYGLSISVLIGLNVLLIVAAEATGELFHKTALIHGFALLFIVLAAARVFRRYDVYDPELRIYMRYALAAMTVFAASHLVEL